MPVFDSNHCCLCSELLSLGASLSSSSSTTEKEVQVYLKGLATLKKICREKNQPDLLDYLSGIETSGNTLYVHFDCRRHTKKIIQHFTTS